MAKTTKKTIYRYSDFMNSEDSPVVCTLFSSDENVPIILNQMFEIEEVLTDIAACNGNPKKVTETIFKAIDKYIEIDSVNDFALITYLIGVSLSDIIETARNYNIKKNETSKSVRGR